MTFNEMRAINAARCSLTNLGENVWNFIAAFTFKKIS